jgi:hypothetical protein
VAPPATERRKGHPDVGALAFRLRVRDSAGFLLADAALVSLAAATAMLRITS